MPDMKVIRRDGIQVEFGFWTEPGDRFTIDDDSCEVFLQGIRHGEPVKILVDRFRSAEKATNLWESINEAIRDNCQARSIGHPDPRPVFDIAAWNKRYRAA